MKIKILKDHAAGKVGEIKDVNFPGGDEQEYVDNGFIEILNDDKIQRLEKAREQVCKKLLDDLQINDGDFSKKKWEKLNGNYMGSKCTFEFWEKYWAERNSGEIKEEQEIEQEYIKGINWTDEEYLKDSWKRLKVKTIYHLKQSDHLFQILSSESEIIGKPQIRDNDKKFPIRLITKAIKKKKGEDDKISYKFIDDSYNKRDDGYEDDTLEESFWAYDVVCDGIGYLVFCKDKLENHEVHKFKGTSVKVPHQKEFEKNFSCRGSAYIFFCKESESTIKPLPQEQLIPYVEKFIKENNIEVEEYKKMMFEYIFFHPNGYIYNQPEDYMLLRHAQLLSGKIEGYPLHLFVWSSFGGGKTQELECLDNIFEETILEAANSTPKSLVPSFSGTRPDPGFLLNCNRIALVDELMKMIDNAINNTRNSNDVKNQLSNLNFIFEHRRRRANSGNGGLYCIPTMKSLWMMNPSLKSEYLQQELDTLDSSTMSRVLPIVKAQKHLDFIEKNELRKCANTYSLYVNNSEEKEKRIRSRVYLIAQEIRSFYVTIYDSCQHFLVKSNQGRVEKLFGALTNLARNPMKTVLKRRGLHHVNLVLDGIVKYRCLFRDFDPSFEAINEDYDNAERILVGIVQDWNFNMGIPKDVIE